MSNKQLHGYWIILVPLFLISLSGTTLAAETRWVSDEVAIPLRSGPTNGHRITHRGIPTGTQLDVLAWADDNTRAEVRTRRGTQGWIEAQYLAKQPIARIRLAAAQKEIVTLKRSVAEAKSQIGALSGDKSTANKTNQTLTAQVAKLEREYADLKKISANALKEHAENQELERNNQRLRDELDDTLLDRDQLANNLQQRWLMIGGGLVLIGLILGFVIKSRPRRSAWT